MARLAHVTGSTTYDRCRLCELLDGPPRAEQDRHPVRQHRAHRRTDGTIAASSITPGKGVKRSEVDRRAGDRADVQQLDDTQPVPVVAVVLDGPPHTGDYIVACVRSTPRLDQDSEGLPYDSSAYHSLTCASTAEPLGPRAYGRILGTPPPPGEFGFAGRCDRLGGVGRPLPRLDLVAHAVTPQAWLSFGARALAPPGKTNNSESARVAKPCHGLGARRNPDLRSRSNRRP